MGLGANWVLLHCFCWLVLGDDAKGDMGKEERMVELYPSCMLTVNAACILSWVLKGERHTVLMHQVPGFLSKDTACWERTHLLLGHSRPLELLQCLRWGCGRAAYTVTWILWSQNIVTAVGQSTKLLPAFCSSEYFYKILTTVVSLLIWI